MFSVPVFADDVAIADGTDGGLLQCGRREQRSAPDGKEACVKRKTGGGAGDEDASVLLGNIDHHGWEQHGQHMLGVLEVKQTEGGPD